jgi:hypothetical protein
MRMKITATLLLTLGAISAATLASAQWPARFNGTGNWADAPSAITTDSAGSVIVVGGTTSTGSNGDLQIVKYASNGTVQWRRKYNGPDNLFDVATSVTTDGTNNVLVAGFSDSSGTGEDFVTMKLDANGTVQWVRRFDGASHGPDVANKIAVDPLGNVYVTGTSTLGAVDRNFLTVKYDANGNKVYHKSYTSPGIQEDEAIDVIADVSGNAYVVGRAFFTTTRYDYVLIKYSPTGSKLWLRKYDGASGQNDAPIGLKMDWAGDIIVAGTAIENAFSAGYTLVKYNSDGLKLWVSKNGTVDQDEIATAMAIDDAGNVYVTGYAGTDYELLDYHTVKVDAKGVRQWRRSYSAHAIIGGSTDRAFAVDVDGLGNVYVHGTTQGDGVNFDFNATTLKYSPNGILKWAKVVASPGEHMDDFGIAMVVNRTTNRCFVACEVPGGSNGADWLTTRY